MKFFSLAIATGLGAGYMRPASGTWGTLVGIPLVLLLSPMTPFFYLVSTIALLFLGIWASDIAEEHFKKSDASQIVIDEIVGFAFTMFLVPLTWWNIIWAFLLFRFFDIVKFWPARQIDRGNFGGMGVMLDDVAAGAYANISMQILVAFGLFGCGLS